MPDAPRVVVGRVVSLEGGRPVLQTPLGPRPTFDAAPAAKAVDKLIAAARAYRANPTEDTLYDLSRAAKEMP